MALTVGVNSYISVEDADAILLDRLDVAAWVDASLEQKASALITATALLERETWIGQVVDPLQKLAWPRTNGTYFDARLGQSVNLSGTIPNRIVLATVELAYHLLNNDGLLDSGTSIKNVTIGPISIENIIASPQKSSAASSLIAPLLRAGGRNWWRAN